MAGSVTEGKQLLQGVSIIIGLVQSRIWRIVRSDCRDERASESSYGKKKCQTPSWLSLRNNGEMDI